MITLILGGARSGKSEVAERLVAQLPAPVVYMATLVLNGDDDLAARVATHQDRRPSDWKTVEAGGELLAALHGEPDATVLVDSLGPWVGAQPHLHADAAALVAALKGRRGRTVIVSEEVGLGVHPSFEAGREFRDALGDVNRAVAAIANEVLLVVAGRVLPLNPMPSPNDQ